MKKYIIKSENGTCLQNNLSWSLWKTDAKKFDTEIEAFMFLMANFKGTDCSVIDFDN
jgi:hypothetical protein